MIANESKTNINEKDCLDCDLNLLDSGDIEDKFTEII